MKQKTRLAVSVKAATDIFMKIATASIPARVKGQLMMLTSRMIEHPASVSSGDFAPLAHGEEIYALILSAIARSSRARAAARARMARKAEAARITPICTEPIEVTSDEEKKEAVFEKPSRHPRLGIKCRYLPPTSERKRSASRLKEREKRRETRCVRPPRRRAGRFHSA